MISTKLRAGALCALILTPLAAYRSAPPAADHRLQGVWEIHVTPEPGSGIAPYLNIAAITADGRVVNVEPGGAGVGESYRLPPSDFAVGFFGFVDIGVLAQFEVQATVTPQSLDEFAGPFRTTVSDLAGNALFTFEGAVLGLRRTAQPY